LEAARTHMTHMINPKVTNQQRFLIIGTILGGSSIIKPKKGKNCYLSMREKDISWLRFKSEQLVDLASQSPMTIEKTNRWHSVCYPIFNEFRGMFYEDDRRSLKIDTLNLLHDSSIAIWFGDAGKCKGDRVLLNTNIWGKEGTNLIVEYFKSLEWDASVALERKNFRVKLGEESSKEFLSMVSSYLPKDRKCGRP
jgi:hypothetical protein